MERFYQRHASFYESNDANFSIFKGIFGLPGFKGAGLQTRAKRETDFFLGAFFIRRWTQTFESGRMPCALTVDLLGRGLPGLPGFFLIRAA
ncbi:MAG: hypothetical protein KJ606_08495 [Chloroflexi bacterium]|nr:hypothetical protein [Chloroflexota bacterium]